MLIAGYATLLWFAPFRRAWTFAERTRRRSTVDASPDQIGWAVEAAGRYVPNARCLARALAARTLLGWAGHESDVRFGVAKDPAGRLHAHAWAEVEGRVIVGAHDASDFRPMHLQDSS